jgi:hypothetical protein
MDLITAVRRASRDDIRRAAVPMLATLCALLFVAQLHWRPALFTLVLEMRADRPLRLQLLHDRDYDGVSQRASATRFVESHGEFTTVRFPIESNYARNLGLIGIDHAGPFEIREVRLDSLGSSSRRLSLGDVRPGKPETKITFQAAGTILVSSDKAEPAVAVSAGSLAKAPWFIRLIPWLFVGVIACVCVLFGRHLRPGLTATNAVGAATSPFRSRRLIIGLLILGYVVASLLQLNGSSTALWQWYGDREVPRAGILVGSPKDVRSEEWLLQTPWILSQAVRTPAFSATNPTVGSDVTPLVTNLPVRHWSTLFRPQMWPFFLMPLETAFAFYWNFKLFGLLLAAVLFFGSLTGGRTAIALAGALFLTFSPYVQWWFSSGTCLPEMMALLFFGLWLATLIRQVKARWQIVAAAVGLLVTIEGFILCCYPRFQVPLAYFAAVFLAGTLAFFKTSGDRRMLRLCCFVCVIVTAGVVTWLWWRDVAGVIRITSQLSYPGQVRSTGGEIRWNELLAPFLDFSMTQERFPIALGNVCQAAGFLFLAPLLAAAAFRDWLRYRNVDRIVLLQLALIAGALWFMMVGIPTWLARSSGWDYVYSSRAVLLLGVATTVALVRSLAQSRNTPALTSNPLWLFGGLALLLVGILYQTNVRLSHFETVATVISTALFFALLCACFWRGLVAATWILLLVPQLYACALINPVTRGLPGVMQSPLLRWLTEAHALRPNARWIVVGETLRAEMLPELLKAAGIEVLGGVRCNPDYEMLRVLDPTGSDRAIYDQYTSAYFRQADISEPAFVAHADLSYDIRMPLRADLLDRLSVQCVLQVDMAEGPVPPGFQIAARGEGLRLLDLE